MSVHALKDFKSLPPSQRQLRAYLEHEYRGEFKLIRFGKGVGRPNTSNTRLFDENDKAKLAKFLVSGEYQDFSTVWAMQEGYKRKVQIRVQWSGVVCDLVTSRGDILFTCHADEVEAPKPAPKPVPAVVPKPSAQDVLKALPEPDPAVMAIYAARRVALQNRLCSD